MSGTLGNFDAGFVYYEDGQWYYDDDSANPVSFNPDSFTGTTTGTDGTTTAKLVALGALSTGSSADSISQAGLFSDPRDLKTVELPQNFIEVTNFATQLESDTYVQDTSGWKIERSGDVEFNNITARGEIHATSGSISESVQIGGTDLNDYVSRATGSLALMINKKSGGTLTGNGEAVLVGVEQGAAVTQQNGFITWDGAQVEIDYDQTAQAATFATQVQEQRGFICVDVNKETPFTINSGGGTVNVDVAFVYKIDDQWYYDNNSSSTTGVSFTPSTLTGSDGSSATELVAIGFIETGSSDVIQYGGLFGQPVPLELAAMPADALESGSIGGIKISNNKLYEGNGSFKDANTGFYLDSGGDFSLKNKLFFDNSASELTVKGEIDAETLNVVEANVLGGINATSITDGIVSFDSFSEEALDSLDTRFGRTGGFFDEEYLTGYDGTQSTSVFLSPVSHDGATNFVLSWGATKSWVSATNISGDGLKLKVTFRYTAGGVTTTLGSTQTFAATKTQLQDGNYVYDFSELTRLEVTGSTISSGTITLSVLVEEFSAASNCFELISGSMLFEFRANQDNPDLTVTGTFISSGLTYPTADGTNGQVITTDGSGNLSFSTVSGGGNFLTSDADDTMDGMLTVGGTSVSGSEGGEIRLTAPPTTSLAGDVSVDLNGNKIRFFENSGNTRGAYITLTECDNTANSEIWHSGNDGAGSGLAADTLDGYHAAQTSGDWFNHIPKVDSNGNMEIGRFTDWHYTDTSTASYDARSEILSTGVLRHTTAYGYIDLGPANTSYAHISTDRAQFYFNKKLIVDEGIIRSYDEDLQLAAGYGGSTSITIDHADNEVTFNESINIAASKVLSHNTDPTRDKIRLWNTSTYAIGFDNAMTYGLLNGYAMTFQMNSDADRGWVFLDTSHSDAQGAMSLTTEGKMTLATSLSVGEGQSITSPQTDVLYVKGNPNFAVMPTFETEGKIIISRGDNVDREHEIRFDNSSLASDNYMKFAVHNATVGSKTDVLGLFGDNRAQIFGAAVIGNGASLASSFNASANRLIVGDGAGNEGLTIFSGTTSYGSIHFADTATTGGGSYNGYINHNQNNAKMTFGTNSAARMDIDSAGNVRIITGDLVVSTGDLVVSTGDVGIGEANPAYKLDLIGSIRIQEDAQTGYTHSRLITESNSTSRGSGHFMWTSPGATEWYMGRPYTVGDEWMVARRQGGTSHSDATADRQYALLTVKNSGRVGIGEKDPDSMLEVNSGSLGTTGGNELPVLNLQFASSNLDRLTVTARRKSTGTDWQTAAHKIQRTVDITDMGYIQFGKNGADDDLLTFGKGSTEYMRIDGVGDVGINKTNPSAKFHVNGTARFDHSEHQGFHTQVTDSTADTAFHGHYLDVNMSGSDALTGDRTHAGLYLDLDSSATGGDQSNEHRVYGIYSDTRVTGDSDLVYAAYNYARADHSSGTISSLRGASNLAMAHNSSGAISNVYGAYNLAYDFTSGTGAATNIYGSFNHALAYSTSASGAGSFYGQYNLVQVTGTQSQNITQLMGSYSEVQIDSNSNSYLVSTAYVHRAEYDHNDSDNSATVTTGYLYYGNYSGTLPTNAYGVYINNDVINYFQGRVGIGTSPGNTKLDVYGGSGIGRARFFNGGTSANYIDVDSHYWRTAAGSTRALLNSTNLYLYLNNANQSHRFTFNESGGEIQLANSSGTQGTLIDLTTGASRFISTIDGHNLQIGCGGGNTTGAIEFLTNNFSTIGMKIIADGSVGIGAAPFSNTSLDINGGSLGRHLIHFNGSSVNYYDVNTHIWRSADGSTTLARLNSTGLGIQNTSPDSALNVKGQAKFGDTSDGTQIRINASSNSGIVEGNAPSGLILRSNYVGTLSHIVFNTNGSTEAMRLRHDQKLLFGTISVGGEGGVTFNPSHSNGAAQQIFNRASTTSTSVVMRFRNAGTNVGQISHTNSSTSYITTSDRRLKENIVDAPSASDDIEAIQVRSFDWKESGEHQKYGMIAQELQAVAPDAVSEGDEDDDIMGVDYSKLVPMLIKEIQSLRARVAQLEEDE